jgi:methanogenic corrinoid protein MtbC1
MLCNRQQIKCFLKALNENDILFYEIVSLALTQVIHAFKQKYNEDKKEQNYLMINDLIKQSVMNISKALLTCSTADDIINALKVK